jgi:ABC-type sugar transport system ATPase subunit
LHNFKDELADYVQNHHQQQQQQLGIDIIYTTHLRLAFETSWQRDIKIQIQSFETNKPLKKNLRQNFVDSKRLD